jgi:AbrB family looped-hinge helix DNA binding protein
MKSRISSKGQVTVPVEVRNQLGLMTGTEIEFLVRDGEAILRKGRRDDDPIGRVYGRLTLAAPVDELLDAMRGPRPTATRRPRPRTRRR